MIRKAKYENFKGLRSVEVAFDSPFTVLVGPNASGKTSVLQGIEIVVDAWKAGPSASFQHTGSVAAGLGQLRTAGIQSDVTLQILDKDESGFGVQHMDKVSGQSGVSPGFTGAPNPLIRIKSGRIKSEDPNLAANTPYWPVMRPDFRSSEIAEPS